VRWCMEVCVCESQHDAGGGGGTHTSQCPSLYTMQSH
jgi:hypothetical protein